MATDGTPTLTTCPSCSSHVHVNSCACAHCGVTLKVCRRGGAVTVAGAALLGLATMTSCVMKTGADYGGADTNFMETGLSDADGDGSRVIDGDCDDDNPDIFPGATETPGDGVDSNCDGDDDT